MTSSQTADISGNDIASTEAITDAPDNLDAAFSKITNIEKLHSGDAKFFGNDIATSVDSRLAIYNLDGECIKTFDDIASNWLDVCYSPTVSVTSDSSNITSTNDNASNDNINDVTSSNASNNSSSIGDLSSNHIIVYCNGARTNGVVTLDDDYNIISNISLPECPNLTTDPTITEFNGSFYITVTEIEGTVNNDNPDAENGHYTIHMYRTDNLTDFEYIGDVCEDDHNLEDVVVLVNNNRMYVVFEREIADKKDSGIYIKSSSDGINWSDETELLPQECDHEVAKIFSENVNVNATSVSEYTSNTTGSDTASVSTDTTDTSDTTTANISDTTDSSTSSAAWTLFYSCDTENRGDSYMGASAYYAKYDKDFNCIEKDVKIDTQSTTGILLYDVIEEDEQTYLLYAKNYLSDNDLVVENGR